MNALRIRPATALDLPTVAEWLARPVALPTDAQESLWVVEVTEGEVTDGAASGGEAPAGNAPHGKTAPANSAHVLRAALRLVPAIGLTLPRVSYHVGCTVHAAAELGLHHRQRTLLLGHDHTGASELADIGWARQDVPLAEQAGALHALVTAALQHLGRQRQHFASRLIAELPGPRDAAGQSPFWQGLGRHFYRQDPAAALAVHGLAWRSHVASLLPRHLLVTSFLTLAAEAAIAQVSADALLLREVLEDAGLRYSHHVNVEDGGPILEAAVDDLPAVRSAQQQPR